MAGRKPETIFAGSFNSDFRKFMGVFVLKRVQNLPLSLEQAWDFFATPANLKEITPAYMGFEMLSDSGSGNMYPGQIISYYIKPFPGMRFFWLTEITHVKDQHFFVDEQRSGPYAFWHHTHFFKEIKGGIEMTDLVHYQLPFGFLGKLVHELVVKRRLKEIFDFRAEVLVSRFGAFPAR
jgi:ligand-binding SRPBCC domain-containing protein